MRLGSMGSNRYIFTAHKRSLGKVMFYTCLSVILFTGECLPLGPGRVSASGSGGVH